MRLEETVGKINLITDLSTGSEHRIYVIENGGEMAVLKLYSPETSKYEKYRTESDALCEFGPKGLAPLLLYDFPNEDAIIMTYENTNLEDFATKNNLIKLLEKISGIKQGIGTFKEYYFKEVLCDAVGGVGDPLCKTAKAIYEPLFESFKYGPLVNSHGDFRLNNMALRNKELIAIDWENSMSENYSYK